MREAPVGLVGAFAANRPYLSLGLIAPALIALAVVGARQAGAGAGAAIADLAAVAAGVLIAPMMLASATPQQGVARYLFIALVVLAAAALVALDAGWIVAPGAALTPPTALTLAAFGLYVFLVALAPLAQNVTRLSLPASFAAVLGVAGAAGYLAMEGMLGGADGAIAAAFGLALGVGVGVNIAADFAKFFAAGENRKRAAAAAGHGAVALSVFYLLASSSFFALHSFETNFGAVDWAIVWAGITVVAASLATVLAAVTGGLALARASEQVAVDENRRRRWFSMRWRPVRLMLPATTATATVAIAAILVVIALFEVGLAAPMRFGAFIAAIWIAGGVAFVSLRTSALIALLLAASAVLANFVVAVVGAPAASETDQLAALTLLAAALGAMTVSWRDAGESWRNARDVVEHALNDGLRRFLFLVGAGAAGLYASVLVFDWAGGVAAVIYFLTAALIALALAPAAMTAMSAQFRA